MPLEARDFVRFDAKTSGLFVFKEVHGIMVTPNTSVNGQPASQETLVAVPSDAKDVTPSPETAGSPATDYKAEAERLTKERDDFKRQLDRAIGRVKTNVPDQTLQAIRLEVNRNAREIRELAINLNPNLSEEEKAQAKGKLTQEQQTDQETRRFDSHATRLANRLNRKLEQATFLRGNAELQRLLGQWNQSTNIDQVDDAYDAVDDFIDAELDKYTKAEIKTANDKVAQERTRANRANNTLEVATPAGTMPAGLAAATRDNIDGLYVAWDREHPNDKNPYEDRYRTFIRTGEL